MENRKEVHKQDFTRAGGHSKKIAMPCTEAEILYLQTIFTTPGLHSLTVSNIQDGRQMIMEQLKILQWHQEVGFLTADQTAQYLPAQNLVTLLDQPIDQEGVEAFFIEHFYYDFLWIECTHGLLNMHWIYSFETELFKYRLDTMIPIVLLTYH